jgi:hypothetical protein
LAIEWFQTCPKGFSYISTLVNQGSVPLVAGRNAKLVKKRGDVVKLLYVRNSARTHQMELDLPLSKLAYSDATDECF